MKLSKREVKVLGVLDPTEPVNVDAIIQKSRFQPGAVLAALLEMEIKRLVRQLPGARYITDPSLPYFLGTSKTRTWLEGHEATVLRMLDPVKPRHVDKITELSELDPREVLAALDELELRRLARRLRGQHYVKFVE